MINPTDESFILQIAPELQGFKKSNKNYNFRCPFCGDSAKNIRKQRGWLIDYRGNTIFKCFNCGLSASLAKFLKSINEDCYKKYIIHKNQNRSIEKTIVELRKEKSNITYKDFINCEGLANCSKLNEGSIYLHSRKIKKLDLFYYTEDYGNLLKQLKLTKYEAEWINHEPRLVIPHWNRDKELTFIQFRNMNPKAKLRYKTYRIIEDSAKIWGLERVNWNKPVFICEGALDASFIENGLAMSGADVDISNPFINNYRDNLYFILDNEPYNREICERYKKLCRLGFNVFIWPNVEPKDINDYYLKYNNVDIFTDMTRYYNGLRLKLELSKWIKN